MFTVKRRSFAEYKSMFSGLTNTSQTKASSVHFPHPAQER